MQKSLWIIDDEQAICWALTKAFEQAGYLVTAFSNAEDAIKLLPEDAPLDAVLLDMRLPGMDGFEATAVIKKIRPHVPVVVMTAFGDLASAIQAIDLDVFEYLPKPFDLSDGLKAISKAIESRYESKSESAKSIAPFDALMGSSPAIQTVYKQIAIAAKSDVAVLIHGPSGTGKESVASAIHRYSSRCQSPFLVFSPISVPPIALSMELLGGTVGHAGRHKHRSRGNSQTNSILHRSGAFELAGQGMLYIDEVTDLSLSLQSQLLRVLEQRSYLPLGDSHSRECNARIVVSTCRNLSKLVAEGDFLEELRQRLSAFVIQVRPLSERREDILPLANALLSNLGDYRSMHFSKAAESWLLAQPWPGNLRELQAAIQHALLVSKSDRIEVDDLMVMPPSLSIAVGQESVELLSDAVRNWTCAHLKRLEALGQRIQGAHEDVFGTMYDELLATVEPPLLLAMLTEFQNNRAAVASQLGLHRSTLRQKMRRYKIDSAS